MTPAQHCIPKWFAGMGIVRFNQSTLSLHPVGASRRVDVANYGGQHHREIQHQTVSVLALRRPFAKNGKYHFLTGWRTGPSSFQSLIANGLTGSLPADRVSLGNRQQWAQSMDSSQLRHRISFEAARLLQGRRVNNYGDARWRAARSITRSYLPKECLPTDVEIRVQLQLLMGSAGAFPVTVPGPDTTDDDDLPEDRFEHYLALLMPLDRVIQSVDTHPEGDVLYHSLQVFELSHQTHPWDEELLTAALMHDIGKGIDPRDSHQAGLNALGGFITPRTRWLIENLPLVHRIFEGTLGGRAKRRLATSESWEELDVLAAHDREGRVPGRSVRAPEGAIDVLRTLSGS
jgi:hypothetical protein